MATSQEDLHYHPQGLLVEQPRSRAFHLKVPGPSEERETQFPSPSSFQQALGDPPLS